MHGRLVCGASAKSLQQSSSQFFRGSASQAQQGSQGDLQVFATKDDPASLQAAGTELLSCTAARMLQDAGHADACWRLLALAGACWRLLALAGAC